MLRNGKFQWERLEGLIALAREGSFIGNGKLELNETVKDALKV